MTSDLLIVANRLPVDRVKNDDGSTTWRKSPGGLVTAIEPVREIAERYRGKLPTAVATGGYRDVITRTLRVVGMSDWFDAMVCAEDTARHKPEPDVFLEAARRLNVEPTKCVVFEDTDIGLEAARRADMHGVDVRLWLPPRAGEGEPRQ